jgi:hypothetical protein
MSKQEKNKAIVQRWFKDFWAVPEIPALSMNSALLTSCPTTRMGQGDLLGEALTGVDIQLSFVGELAGLRTDRGIYPNLAPISTRGFGVSRHALPTRPPSREAAPTASRRRSRE